MAAPHRRTSLLRAAGGFGGTAEGGSPNWGSQGAKPPVETRGMVRWAAGPVAAAALLVASTATTGCESDSPRTELQGQVHLTLIHTSDIHSRLFPYNLQLGQVDSGLGLGEALTVADVGGIAR